MSEPPQGFLKEVQLEKLDAEDAVKLVIEQAAAMGASDLYIAPEESSARISVRHLGIVRTLATTSSEQGRRMAVNIKALAEMDIAEKRKPLDGRRLHRLQDGRRVDLRIGSIPTLFGEDIVMRLLDRETQSLTLEQLGMSRREFQLLLSMLSSPSGLILVTGPTGSGKTTSLYACLQHLNDGTRKIYTIEDPIEYAVQGVRQCQVNLKHGVDFPDLLRGVLRQSPDVIMVGEIRDSVTAQTAVRAANSGHLVFATLHAPVAAAAIQSMLSLGVHPHFLSSSMLGVVAQRLVRTLCPETKIAFDVSESPHTFEDLKPWLEANQGTVIYGPGKGDPQHPDGYSGRSGVFEVMSISREIRRIINEGRPSRDMEQRAISEGMLEFRRSALLKVAQGVTSTEEVLRAVPTEYLGLDD